MSGQPLPRPPGQSVGTVSSRSPGRDCRVLSMKRFQLVIIAALAITAGCTAALEEVRPPADQFFFPTGLAVSADESVLFVTNANSELRYDSGTVSVVDVAKVAELRDAWLDPNSGGVVPSGRDCEIDVDHAHILICNEAEVVIDGATVRTGNFATELGTQQLDSGNIRLFIAMRGDPSVTWIDYDPSARELSCGGSGTIPVCDEAHRLTQMRNDLSLPTLFDEPFGIYVDSVSEYVMVTHLTSGAVSLLDAPADGSDPMITDSLAGLFAANALGVRGAVGVAGRSPGSASNLLYVTSRSESRVQTLSVARLGDSGLPTIVPSDFFFLRDVAPSDDSRGITFNASGDRAFIVNRDPPMLLVVDTSIDTDGRPRNELVNGIEICPQAANVVVGDPGGGERAYVSCFRDGQVWVIDPISADVESIVNVGRGPHSMRIAPAHRMLFVGNFLDDTVDVIDLTPGSPTENRVALQLGRSRAEGGN